MKLYKGSIYPINVKFAPCYCDDSEAVSDLTLNFYTTDPEHSVEFSGDSITVSGLVATVVFQPAQLDALEDGVLRFISEFNYSGNPETWACATDKYLVTPPNYEPVNFITEDNIGEELGKKSYILTDMTQEERAALYQELRPYMTVQRSSHSDTMFPSPDFPVSYYKFYCNLSYLTGGFYPLTLDYLYTDGTSNYLHFQGWFGTMSGGARGVYNLHEDGTISGAVSEVGVKRVNGITGNVWVKTINGNELVSRTQGGNIEIASGVSSGEVQTMIESALTDYSTSGETAQAISTAVQNKVSSTSVTTLWRGTRAQYDAITTKDPNTLYFVSD